MKWWKSAEESFVRPFIFPRRPEGELTPLAFEQSETSELMRYRLSSLISLSEHDAPPLRTLRAIPSKVILARSVRSVLYSV